MSMFIPGKNYLGSVANSMVQGMVTSYKTTIGKLEKANKALTLENDSLTGENKHLSGLFNESGKVIEGLRTSNGLLKKEIDELKKTQTNAKLKAANKQLVEENKQLRIDNEELHELYIQAVTENEQLAKTIARLRAQVENKRTKSDDEIWASKELISAYGLDNGHTEVRFNHCIGFDGTEYIDARKFYEGNPTRKGICLEVEDFDTFLRYGRTVWARITSGLFNKSNKKEEDCPYGKRNDTCKGCKGRF